MAENESDIALLTNRILTVKSFQLHPYFERFIGIDAYLSDEGNFIHLVFVEETFARHKNFHQSELTWKNNI